MGYFSLPRVPDVPQDEKAFNKYGKESDTQKHLPCVGYGVRFMRRNDRKNVERHGWRGCFRQFCDCYSRH